jgi:membrane protein
VTLALGVLQFMVLAAAIAGLFHYVPNTEVRWRHAAAGGIFVAVGFEVAKKVLAWYLVKVPTYAAVYGAFATVPIFLIWLYLGWVIVLLGAVIAAYAPSLQMHVARRPDTPGQRFELAVLLLRELAQARRLSMHGLGAEPMARALRTDPLQIEPLLETFVALDWVGRLDEEPERRYVLLSEPATTRAQPLLAALLLDPTPALRGFWHRASFGEMTLQDLLEG